MLTVYSGAPLHSVKCVYFDWMSSDDLPASPPTPLRAIGRRSAIMLHEMHSIEHSLVLSCRNF